MGIKDKLNQMSSGEMKKVLQEVFDVLYTEIDGNTITETPDKEWDDETIDMVAECFNRNGLTPEEAIEYPAVS